MQLQSSPHASDSAPDSDQQTSEALFIRNYDSSNTADLTVQFNDNDGNTIFGDRYQIDPLITKLIDIPLSPGGYRVTVLLDTGTSDSAVCHITDDPTALAAVETGNGVVSVVDGLWGYHH